MRKENMTFFMTSFKTFNIVVTCHIQGFIFSVRGCKDISNNQHFVFRSKIESLVKTNNQSTFKHASKH